jgi:hypothetical protein
MKNYTKWMGILVPVLLVMAGTAWGTTLSFNPENSYFSGDEQYTVSVMLDSVEDLLGASLVLTYDPAVVAPVAVTSGQFLNDGPCSLFFQWLNAGDPAGTIEIDSAMLGCTIDGGGVLMEITFAGVGAGSSQLAVQFADLRDSQNAPIPVLLEEGWVTYVPEITANLTFLPEAVVFEEDGTAEICLNLLGVPDFLGMSVVFGFNPAVIVPVAVEGGPALQNAGCPYFLDWLNSGDYVNTMELDMALLGCSEAVDGAVVCVTFQGVESGESPLTWLAVDVRNSGNGIVPVNTVDGVVLYNSAVSTTPTTFDGLKSVYRN